VKSVPLALLQPARAMPLCAHGLKQTLKHDTISYGHAAADKCGLFTSIDLRTLYCSGNAAVMDEFCGFFGDKKLEQGTEISLMWKQGGCVGVAGNVCGFGGMLHALC
jgi:hypothetical protein